MTPKRRIIPIFIPHLGCPQNCVFCNQKHISGQLAPVTPEDVRGIIETGLEKLPDGAAFEVAFYGGSFTAIPEEDQLAYLDAAMAYMGQKGDGAIRLSTRPDCINENTLDRLAKYPVDTIELGSQSMDDEVLKLSNRGHTALDTRRAAALIKSRGFHLGLQMMTGLPGDTLEKAIYTARSIAALKPDCVRIYPTVIVRDTPLYDMWLKGDYRAESPEEAARWCADLLDIFDEAGIPVIRLGLNPTDELSGGEAVGGAYHPALGEMARSVRYLRAAAALIAAGGHTGSVTLAVAPGQTSAMTGQHRCNIAALRERFGLLNVKITEDPRIEKGKVLLVGEGKT